MLTKRIIPCLDVKEGRVVKGTNFVGLRDASDPVERAAAMMPRVLTSLFSLILLRPLRSARRCWMLSAELRPRFLCR